MATKYLSKELFNTTIYLKLNELSEKNINDIIYHKLKNLNEGICNNNGFVLPNSINIINKSIGKIVNVNTDSLIEYTIKYEANILSPKENDIINCYIDNINKLGIIAYIKLSDLINKIDETDIENLSLSPFIIIIPEKEIDNISNYNINDNINIIVSATRIKYKSDKIQIIGKIDK